MDDNGSSNNVTVDRRKGWMAMKRFEVMVSDDAESTARYQEKHNRMRKQRYWKHVLQDTRQQRVVMPEDRQLHTASENQGAKSVDI